MQESYETPVCATARLENWMSPFQELGIRQLVELFYPGCRKDELFSNHSDRFPGARRHRHIITK
jgi:hypothetical protein